MLSLLYVEYCEKYCRLWEYLLVFLLVYFVYRIDCNMRRHSLSKNVSFPLKKTKESFYLKYLFTFRNL